MRSDIDFDCRCDACGSFFTADQLDTGPAVVVRVEGGDGCEYRCGVCVAGGSARPSDAGKSGDAGE
jgi:hypothetical protein